MWDRLITGSPEDGFLRRGEKMLVRKKVGKGVRVKEHESRKHRGRPDLYFSIRYRVGGKLIEEGLGWSSEGWNASKAIAEREKLRQSHRTGEGPQTLREKRQLTQEKRQAKAEEEERQKRESLTFGELMEKHYLPWAKADKKHWKDDLNRFRVYLAGPLGDKSLKDITPFMLEGVKKSLGEKGLAGATVKHALAIIRQAFNKAALWGLYDGPNPVKGVKLPKLNNAQERVLTPEEEDRLMTALKAKSQQVHDMAMMSLYAGLRFAEVAAIRWGDIDENNRLHVRGKGGKVRKVLLAPRLQEILKDRQPADASPADLVFPDRKSGKAQDRISATYYRTVAELGLNAGRERKFSLDFHALRHTFATRLAAKGTPITVLRDLLGHADLKMVSRYSHEAPSVADEAIRSLDQESRGRENGSIIRRVGK
jgi:integrase